MPKAKVRRKIRMRSLRAKRRDKKERKFMYG